MAELASWSDVRAHLGARYQVIDESARGLLRVRVPVEDGSAPTIGVRLLECADRPWLQVVSTLGRLSDVRAVAALASSFQRAIGALAAHGEWLVLAQTLPVRGLNSDHLDHVLVELARQHAGFGAELAAPDSEADISLYGYLAA